MTLRPWAGNLLLLSASGLLGLGALEIGARVVIARRPIITTGEQGIYSQLDPVLGWRNRPGTSVRYSRRDYQTNVAINSLGFRDVERAVTKTPGTTRVLAIGDSFIEAYTVELEESVTRRAESTARASGCPVEVVNAGVHGYSTDQEALWYAREAEPLGADVVLVFAYYNDILNNIRVNYWGSPKPLTKVTDGRIVPVNLPLPEPSRTAESQGIQTKARPAIEGSALRQVLLERIVLGAPKLHGWLARIGVLDPIVAEAVPDELRAYKSRGQLGEFDEAWESTRSLFGALGEIIRARNARPVLVYIPARFEISRRDWDLTVQRYGLEEKAWDRTRVRTRLKDIATPAGWDFLDLTPSLEAATSPLRGETYLPYDGHWNPRGHDVAARAVVAYLRERNLVRCDSPRT
ncbi:MAG: SGNH/GDSL hydrolase family protein [Vicinamibacteria bacterium]|nr:SGNH/GDSL hydrolase family protein [Vicinamibacteria bacterium]